MADKPTRLSEAGQELLPPVEDTREVPAMRRVALGAGSAGALAVGAFALGAVAMGAVAIGALAVGRMAIGKLRIREARIDNLSVGAIEVDEPTGKSAK